MQFLKVSASGQWKWNAASNLNVASSEARKQIALATFNRKSVHSNIILMTWTSKGSSVWWLLICLPLQAAPLCLRRVWSCCVPGTWHTFPHPGPPLPKIVQKDGVKWSYVFCSSVTITPGFTEFTRTFFGASSNATHLQVCPGLVDVVFANLLLCLPGHLVQSSFGDIVRQYPSREIFSQ